MFAYCDGREMDVFYRDRMQNLYRFGMVVSENNRIRLTPVVGIFFGRLAQLLHAVLITDKEVM
ncbi:MAG: hypothetical protein A2Y78_16335 [Acidobacteria bacterium RBG_13_68_16]|nr:MAG: hypothetical protein A2Y78_16335 [Acidobacteria bacterium RBG_13_68_16]